LASDVHSKKKVNCKSPQVYGRIPRILSELEKRIVHALQEDLPVVASPFAAVAKKLAISEEMLLEKIREFMADGTIRRFGATLRHQHSGFEANAMVVWQVSPEKMEEVGKILSSFREVTHCYQRPTRPDWPYSIFTMIHAKSAEECTEIVQRMATAAQIEKYQLLYTVEELKKTTMGYFAEDRDSE